jgi:hypothetical protein
MKRERYGVRSQSKRIALACCVSLGLFSASGQMPTNQFRFEDYLLVPLAVHFLAASNSPSIQTTLTDKDIERILGKMNRVWGQAGVHFYLQSLRREETKESEKWAGPDRHPDGADLLNLRPREFISTNAFNIYYIKKMSVNGIYFPEGIFVKDSASLRPVEGGIDEPLPRVSSHELGHALGLSHRQNTTNLMASGTTGTWLNTEEIHEAREKAREFEWIVPAPQAMRKANTLFDQGKRSEARLWYLKVANISLDGEEVKLARKRIAGEVPPWQPAAP